MRVSGSRVLQAATLVAIAWVLAGGLGASGRADGAEAAGDIAALLPQSDDIAGWLRDGSPHAAEGQQLFALINGGAELFLQAGFDRAIAQAYRGNGDRRVQLEIYRMHSPEAAEAVFQKKATGGEPPIPLGAGSGRGEYYIIFWQDRYLVTVTGSDASQDTMRVVERLARLVEDKLSRMPR